MSKSKNSALTVESNVAKRIKEVSKLSSSAMVGTIIQIIINSGYIEKITDKPPKVQLDFRMDNEEYIKFKKMCKSKGYNQTEIFSKFVLEEF